MPLQKLVLLVILDIPVRKETRLLRLVQPDIQVILDQVEPLQQLQDIQDIRVTLVRLVRPLPLLDTRVTLAILEGLVIQAILAHLVQMEVLVRLAQLAILAELVGLVRLALLAIQVQVEAQYQNQSYLLLLKRPLDLVPLVLMELQPLMILVLL